MASAPPNKIERAHQMYRDGSYEQALGFYTEALAMAKTKPQMIALHSNRAACYLKLHHFKKAAEECTSVLELDHNHTGALMLRAQTLVTLTEYDSALFDVNRLMELNPSSEVYHNLHARLKTQLSLAPIPEADSEEEEEEVDTEEEVEEDTDIVTHTHEDEERHIEQYNVASRTDENSLLPRIETGDEVIAYNTLSIQKSSEQGKEAKAELKRPSVAANISPQTKTLQESSDQHSQGWQAIPKPKGHSTLDYARWSKVADDSSDDEDDDDDDEDDQPQYRFRVKTVGVRQVK